MKADSENDLTFTGHWYVDEFNTTSVIEKLENGGFKHICSCNYGYSDPLKYIKDNQINAHKIATLPYLIEKLYDVLLELDSANMSSHSQMKYAIESGIESIQGILEEYNKQPDHLVS